MLDTEDSLLKLTVNDDTVGYNQNRIEYIVIICIMDSCQYMSQPGNGFCFSTSGRMLDEVVARCMIDNYIIHNTLNGTKLMETRENQNL